MTEATDSNNVLDPEKAAKQLERENRRLQRKLANMQEIENRTRALAAGKQAADKLRDEEKRKQDRYMNLLQANVPDIILMFDKHENLANCSESYLRATNTRGYSLVDGKPLSEILSRYIVEGLEEATAKFREAIIKNEHFNTTAKFDFSKSGTARDYEVLVAPIMGEEEEFDGFLILIHDITELVQRERMVSILNDVATVFLTQNIDTFEETMAKGIGHIVDLIQLDRISLFKNEEKDGELFANQIYRWERQLGSIEATDAVWTELAYSDFPSSWKDAVASGQTLNAPTSQLPEIGRVVNNVGGSIFITPILNESGFWGFVVFEDLENERVFSNAEVSILHSAALMMSDALHSYEEAVRAFDADERMRLLLNATPMGCQIIDREGNALDCNQAVLDLFGFETREEFFEKAHAYNPEHQPDGRLSTEKRAEYARRAFEEGRFSFEWMYLTADGEPLPANVTLVCVKYKDEEVLAAYTWDLRLTRKMEENIKLLELEVDKIFIDPLTSIRNRRYFDETLEKTMIFLSRSESPMSLLMLDIDSFKPYNDNYGHAEGDNCLREVANALNASITRTTDFVARYGGEEFVVVLPNTDIGGACAIAQKLLDAVRACKLPHDFSRTKLGYVTVSIGVTTGRVKHTQTAEDYIKRADEALYEAKHAIGDCFKYAEMD